MGQNGWDKFFFVPTLADFDFERYANYVLHIFCMQGSMEFTVRNVSPYCARRLCNPSLCLASDPLF